MSPSRPIVVVPAGRPSLAGVVLVALCAMVAGLSCDRTPPPGAGGGPPGEPPAASGGPAVGSPVVPEELIPSPIASATPSAAASAPLPPHTGPYLVVTDGSAGVYSDTTLEKDKKIGYLRRGGKVPVHEGTISKANCPRGWYRLRDGGFVCGNVGTTNLTSPEARLATRAPDPEGVLPYTYARNSKNGTPLYKSVPTAEQMRQYEPYLVKKAEPESTKKEKGSAAAPASAAQAKASEDRKKDESEPGAPGDTREPPSRAAASTTDGAGGSAAKVEGITAAALDPALAPAPFSKEAMEAARARVEGTTRPVSVSTLLPASDRESPDAGASDTPWWQRDDADDRLHEVKLDALAADADDILARRMVKGFYVAVDRQFSWHGRPWYKTTKGLVTPADRFWVTKGSEFEGVKLDGEATALPVGFTIGASKGRPTYRLDDEGKLKPSGTVPHRTAVFLTGVEKELGGKRYVETRDGAFMLATHLRITRPGAPPEGLLPAERWIDVNLSSQTLVAFEGTRPVYATLISSGKESKVKEKDHRTPRGEWRIRDKHVTTTMDGDGSAAGDLPYSIEDVPYAMYYHRAYAVHGAFWHSNYGSQMSHGCVNLSPLDAKWVFNFTAPHVPEGWHGAWSTDERPGSRVVVHD